VLAANSGGRATLPLMYLATAVAGATYPPLTAAIRGAWSDLTGPGSGREGLRSAALALETSLFELVFVLGPILVAILVVVANPAAAIAGAALVTLAGTITVARTPIMRRLRGHRDQTKTRGLGPLKLAGFPAMMVCVAGLGTAFGAAGVIVPAYSAAHGGGDGLSGVLLGIWGAGSAAGGFWFGTRRPSMALPRQFAWLLGAVAVSFGVLAAMPNPVALAVALVLGGATIAPALTVETSLVGRITPAGMLNEAFTWVVTVSVGASAAGAALAGLIVDRPGGVPWAFLMAGAAIAIAALVAGIPSGSIARADARATAHFDRRLATNTI